MLQTLTVHPPLTNSASFSHDGCSACVRGKAVLRVLNLEVALHRVFKGKWPSTEAGQVDAAKDFVQFFADKRLEALHSAFKDESRPAARAVLYCRHMLGQIGSHGQHDGKHELDAKLAEFGREVGFHTIGRFKRYAGPTGPTKRKQPDT